MRFGQTQEVGDKIVHILATSFQFGMGIKQQQQSTSVVIEIMIQPLPGNTSYLVALKLTFASGLRSERYDYLNNDIEHGALEPSMKIHTLHAKHYPLT